MSQKLPVDGFKRKEDILSILKKLKKIVRLIKLRTSIRIST